MRAIRINTPGGRRALTLEDVSVPEPGEGQVLVRVAAAGVNFIDVYHRKGFYPLPTPFTIGQEGAGVVERVGPDAGGFRPGDRVAWANVLGSYAEHVVAPAARLVAVPDGVSLEDAAAAMLQGMTAHYLAKSTFPLAAKHVCLIHAAAGGVGLLLVQVAELCGARIIGTVSTEEKAALARHAGADEVIRYGERDVTADVRELTHGHGVDVVYDGVGKATWQTSLDCLRPRGMLVLFGNASGPVPKIDPLELNRRGSLFLTRPALKDHIATREELERRAGDVLEWVKGGLLTLRVHRTYPLEKAAAAHRDLETRKSAGKLLLVP